MMRTLSRFRILMILPYVVALSVLCVATSEARDRNKGAVPSVSEICETILTATSSEIDYVAVKDAPGLRMLRSEVGFGELSLADVDDMKSGLMEPHELVSAVRYARLLHDQLNHSLLLLPRLDGIDIPGFDGVILDEGLQPIANFSLKTLLYGSDPSVRVFEASRKASEYAAIDSWLCRYGIFSCFADGTLAKLTTHYKVKLGEHRLLLSKIFRIFGVKESLRNSRPTRIVIDLNRDEVSFPDANALAELQKQLFDLKTAKMVESVIFMKGPKFKTVWGPASGRK